MKKNLVLFSEADNYDEAKLEWLATGNVWWKPHYENSSDAPDWVFLTRIKDTAKVNFVDTLSSITLKFKTRSMETLSVLVMFPH